MRQHIDLQDVILNACQLIHSFGSSPYMNMCKLGEEVGELAEQTILGLTDRDAVIDEVADVIICAIGQGTFVQMSEEELTAAIYKKLAKAAIVAEAGGKAAYLKAKAKKSGV